MNDQQPSIAGHLGLAMLIFMAVTGWYAANYAEDAPRVSDEQTVGGRG